MISYIDYFGQFHNQPVTESNLIPSNDGFIHTAYAKKAGFPMYSYGLNFLYDNCLKSGKLFRRLPDKDTPPISRDVILGTSYLGLLKQDHLQGWSFSPKELPKFSLFKLFKQLWELKPDLLNGKLTFKHRNYFWKNNLDQIYRFAFSVPLQDRKFLLDNWKTYDSTNPVHLFYSLIAFVDSKLPKKSAIKWLKYNTEVSKEVVAEFPVGHPIRKKLGF